MTYEPSDFLVRLEFDKIIELIANNCLGNLGIEQAHLIAPELHLALIEKKLNEVSLKDTLQRLCLCGAVRAIDFSRGPTSLWGIQGRGHDEALQR